MTTTTEPRIYVACLASYNNGVLHGAWIDATSDVDAMQEEVDAMLRSSKFPNVTVPDYEATARKAGWTIENGAFVIPGDSAASAYATPSDWRGLVEEMELPPIMVPSAEEFAIHDSEGLGDIGEYAGLGEVARRVEIIEAADDRDIPPAVLLEAMSDAGADDAESFIDDHYDGTAETWEAFCEERIGDCYNVDDLPDWVRNYIDFERMGRDWKLSGDWSAYRAGETGELYFFRSN